MQHENVLRMTTFFAGDTNIFTNADYRRIKRKINDEKRERRDYEITPFSDFLKAP